MKRLALFLAACLVWLPVSFDAFSQARVTTKSYRLGDFSTLTTKVVVNTGNTMLDNIILSEFHKQWSLSPFEISSFSEYESLKETPGYYFLFCTQARQKKSPSPILMMSVEKTGKDDAEDPMQKSFDVVNMPLCYADALFGRVRTYVPAFVSIMQDYMETAMESDLEAYQGLSGLNVRMRGVEDRTVLIEERDIAASSEGFVARYPAIMTASEEKIDEVFSSGEDGVLVCYSIVPSDVQKGDYAYYMLIEASTSKLFFFKRRKLSSGEDVGMKVSDFKDMTIKMEKIK